MATPKTRRGPGKKEQRKGFRKVPVERLREQAALESPAAGTAEPKTPPSEEAMRRAIEAQMCPFCGAGPWKALPIHTSKAHGVDKWELRERAGLTTRDPLCSPEVLKDWAERAKKNDNVAAATAASRQARRPQRWTSVGKGKLVQSLREWEQANPEEASAARVRAARLGGVARWDAVTHGPCA